MFAFCPLDDAQQHDERFDWIRQLLSYQLLDLKDMLSRSYAVLASVCKRFGQVCNVNPALLTASKTAFEADTLLSLPENALRKVVSRSYLGSDERAALRELEAAEAFFANVKTISGLRYLKNEHEEGVDRPIWDEETDRKEMEFLASFKHIL